MLEYLYIEHGLFKGSYFLEFVVMKLLKEILLVLVFLTTKLACKAFLYIYFFLYSQHALWKTLISFENSIKGNQRKHKHNNRLRGLNTEGSLKFAVIIIGLSVKSAALYRN